MCQEYILDPGPMNGRIRLTCGAAHALWSETFTVIVHAKSIFCV